jgi:hypothetical protein
LPKIAHYAGFQSYGDLPYPSLKAGKKQLESNTIYQETVRKEDELKFYNNTNRWTTLYDQNLSKTVQPEHYQNPLRVTKQQVERPLLNSTGRLSNLKDSQAAQKSLEGTGDSASLANKGMQLYYQTVTSLKREQGDLNQSKSQRATSVGVKPKESENEPDDKEYLQTGTEHWKTTYVAAIKDPYSYTRASRPEWSLNKPAYSVKGGPRASDYKEQFGERGTNPINKLSRTMHMPPVPVSEESLKLGTTQASHHIPGYTGHLPKSLASPDVWDQALGVHTRTTYLKQNIVENYQTRVPGYSGHRPRNAVNDRGVLRQNCFSTAGERFH